MQNSRHKHFIGLPFPGDTSGKEPVCQGRRGKRCGFHLWVGKSPGGGHGNPLPGESTDRSLVGCGPKGRTQRLDTTETTQHACAQTVLKSCARVLSSTIKPRAVLLLPGSPRSLIMDMVCSWHWAINIVKAPWSRIPRSRWSYFWHLLRRSRENECYVTWPTSFTSPHYIM